jgi:hypothetical protein
MLGEIGHENVGAFARERDRNRTADARVGPCNESRAGNGGRGPAKRGSFAVAPSTRVLRDFACLWWCLSGRLPRRLVFVPITSRQGGGFE